MIHFFHKGVLWKHCYLLSKDEPERDGSYLQKAEDSLTLALSYGKSNPNKVVLHCLLQ